MALGKLAGVSTPTISRFESKETDIQLPTVLNIFRVLGMIDRRELVFDEGAARYDAGREIVIFVGKDGDRVVPCAMSREALEDYFDADNKDLVKIFIANSERIQHEARRKYLADQLESDGSVLIRTADFW